jgi:HMG (high mobility group) box
VLVPGLNTGRIFLPPAFLVYVKDQRDRFREENPNLILSQIGMLMGDHWEAMSAEEKAPYEARTEE